MEARLRWMPNPRRIGDTQIIEGSIETAPHMIA